MSDVLQKHQKAYGHRNYFMIHCICGWKGKTMSDYFDHQEDALTDAGFGAIR